MGMRKWDDAKRAALVDAWNADEPVIEICREHRATAWALKGFFQGAVRRGEAKERPGAFDGLCPATSYVAAPKAMHAYQTSQPSRRIWAVCREDAEAEAARQGLRIIPSLEVVE